AWTWIGFGLLSWTIADIVWHGYEIAGKAAPSFPGPMDLLYVLGYPLIAAGLIVLSRSRKGSGKAETIDSALIAVGLGAVVWVLLAAPYVGAPGYSGLQLAAAVAYPAGDALLLGVIARLLFVGTNRSVSSRFLLGSIAVLLVTDGIYLHESLSETYVSGGWLDLGWLLSYLAIGAAALHPSSAKSEVSEEPAEQKLTLRRLVLAIALPIVGPALFSLQVISGVEVNRLVIILSTGVLFTLSVARANGIVAGFNKQLVTLDSQKADLAYAFESITENNRELRFQAQVLDEVESFVLAFSAGAELTYWNSYAERFFGLQKNALGQTYADLFPNLDGDLLAAIGGSLDRHATWEGDITFVLPNGEDALARTMISQMRDESGAVVGTICMGRDVSGSRDLEERVRRVQKLEAFGQLAGGVAHDFNNLLAIVINYARFLIDDLDNDDPRSADAREIMKAGERGARLTRQLLTFSRKTKIDPETLSLNEIVKDMGQMFSRTISENVRFEVDLAEGLWLTRIDPGHLESVIMNLVVNARDAMLHGGSMTLRTKNQTLDDVKALGLGLQPGRYVSFSVTDTGHGMDEDTRSRIFEPFFTTKDVGKGTGLGLATVYGIVDEGNGTIDVQSTQGVGTTFTVYLPFEAEESKEWQRVSRPDPGLRGNGEKIVLTEDEDGVRELVTRMLRRNGYIVQAYSSAEEAAKDFEEGNAQADLLLTDVVMPGLSGPELSKRLGLPTLFMTGYSEIELDRTRSMKTLSKPFDEAQLVDAVRSVLALTPLAA
ncbi:MAG: two-component system, cell cycle sensor histidine kinase and response regulator CckA, partial [Actinomycetota bacterium]|nr:two-component system, cell cycle sensor histidine kinase and response regulator CckA [Actinomycetota bacterium]